MPFDLARFNPLIPTMCCPQGKRFPAYLIKYVEPPGTMLLFNTRRCVVVGAHRTEDARLIAEYTAREFSRCTGLKATVTDLCLQNVVGGGVLPGPVDLAEVFYRYGACASWEPDSISMVILRPPDIKPVILQYACGSFVVTGSSSVEEFEAAFRWYYADVQSLVKTDVAEEVGNLTAADVADRLEAANFDPTRDAVASASASASASAGRL